MIRERLKEIELKITELADYLQLSRPTMYKFIEYYDNSEFDLINKKVLKLFNYINDNPLVGKRSVVNYILSNFVFLKEVVVDSETEIIQKIKRHIISNPESKKSKFICEISSRDTFDDIIPFLVEISCLMKKKKLTDNEMKKLSIYKEFKEYIKDMGE